MKTRITYTALIQWLTVQAQMEAKNWSKSFKNSVEMYYDLMHQDQLVALADINGFEVIEAVLDTDTIGTEQAQVNTKEHFEKVDKELFDLFTKAGIIKIESKDEPKALYDGPLVKENEIKYMLEKAFPNAVVISPSDLKAMGSDIESLNPHSLSELVEGLGLKDLLTPNKDECTCESCMEINNAISEANKEMETEANNEELAESEAFVSSLVAFFETDKCDIIGMKQAQETMIVDIANLLIENVNNVSSLNKSMSIIHLRIAQNMVYVANTTLEEAIAETIGVNTTDKIQAKLRKLCKVLSTEQVKQIRVNLYKRLHSTTVSEYNKLK